MHSSTNNVSELLQPTMATSAAGLASAKQVSKVTETTEPEQPQIIDDFVNMYQRLNKDTLHLLKQVYSDDIVFQDPLHTVKGMSALTDYFANLYANVDSINFDIQQICATSEQASVFWKMTYSHSKLNRANPIQVDGMSHLIFSDKITSHRDYFDLGQMLYEQIPVLGKVISMVKAKASS